MTRLAEKMRTLTAEEQLICSAAISTEFENVKVTKLIYVSQSASTKSAYLHFLDNKNTIYQIAVSDHYAFLHENDSDDLSDGLLELIDTDNFFDFNMFISQHFGCDTCEHGYYGIAKAEPYKLNPNDLIGQNSFERAWVSNNYRITDAELIFNKQLLLCTYNGYDEEMYFNYIPDVDKTADGCEFVNYLGIEKKDKLFKYNFVNYKEYYSDIEKPIREDNGDASYSFKKMMSEEPWVFNDQFLETTENGIILYDEYAQPYD